MISPDGDGKKDIRDFKYRRATLQLDSGKIDAEDRDCEDMEDFLGGIARSFKFLEDFAVTEAYDPGSPLVVNTGVLSGTDVMTGLRTYFTAYSPLKVSNSGMPAAMWSAGSGKFGTEMRWAGIDEMIFFGRSDEPVYLVVKGDIKESKLSLEPAQKLLGKTTHEKIMYLRERYPDAHFAAIGPAGENYNTNRFAAVAISTENQIKSGDPKPRFAGRGGMGGLMGSKNLLAIVCDGTEPRHKKLTKTLVDVNREIARGDGSKKFREKDKGGGMGGTWSNYLPLYDAGALPEYNFRPRGTDEAENLFRENVEEEYHIKDESCYRCGIACHKNIYIKENGKGGDFLAKSDYEPLNLLSSNLGITDRAQAWEIIALVDEMGFDSISAGVTLGYIMDYNSRKDGESKIADGLEFGDFEGAQRILRNMAYGEEPLFGHGVKRVSEKLGETSFAMQCKGVELPAYLAETNPGYPFAIAGGHMSMKTFLLLIFEGEISVDYWEEAIVERGLYQIRDDLIGLCKFAGIDDNYAVNALNEEMNISISEAELKRSVLKTFIRGYALERKQGFRVDDYVLPDQTYEGNPNIKLTHFITPEFYSQLRDRVLNRFDSLVEELGIA